MRLGIKICGLRTPETVDVAVRAGATAIGLVFADSARRVDPGLAAELLASAAGIEKVAVFRYPDGLTGIAHLPFDGVQTVSGWRGTTPRGWFHLPYWRNVDAAVDEIGARTWRAEPGSLRGAFLLDSPHGGGTGVLGDLERAAAVARIGPMVLAGGLTPGNVAEAVRTVRPHAVDVSSGVEESPGVKDPHRIEAFVAAALGAAGELS